MLKFFRSKLFISIILLLMAGILTFAFLPKMYGSQSTTMNVVQFIDDVNLGTKISEDMLVAYLPTIWSLEVITDLSTPY